MATPFDLFHTHMRAFKLGASTGAIGEWHQRAQNHEDIAIRKAWSDGYAAGREARSTAVEHASKLYDHKPSILRLADGPPDQEDEEAS